MKTLVIVNPMSAKGKTGRDWPALQPRYEAALGDTEVLVTQAAGQATDEVRKRLAADFSRVISVGGDGTNHEVVNGFYDPETRAQISPDAIFAFTARGTGGDLSRTFQPASDLDAELERIAQSDAARIDLVSCEYTLGSETRWEVSINIASVGQGGEVCARVDTSPAKALGGGTPFLLASLESLVGNRPWHVRLHVDDHAPREQKVRNVFVANCRFQGGGMEIAPQAQPDDGLLDLVIMGDLSRIATLRMSRDIYRGRMQEHAGVTHELIKRLRVETLPGEPEMLIEMDGEPRGQAPVTFEVLAAALRLAR